MNKNIKMAKELIKLAKSLTSQVEKYDDTPVDIHIDTENAAFQDGVRNEEIARILRKLADDVEDGKKVSKLMDINGNSCGYVKGI